MKKHDNKLIFFNNCKGSDYPLFFGNPRAFYDLAAEGSQAKLAKDLVIGQQCVVCGKPEQKQLVSFGWFSLTDEYIDPNHHCRVFAGDHLLTERLAKNVAARHPIYRIFFNVKGHFKQQVVLSHNIPLKKRPVLARSLPIPDIDIPEIKSTNGEARKKLVIHLVRERDRKLVAQKKASVDTPTCEVCNFDFQKKYGINYCEVHHLTPLAHLKEGTQTKLDDLAIVCANCHRVIHTQYPPIPISRLRQIIKTISANTSRKK
jgi:ribosomal protein L44E